MEKEFIPSWKREVKKETVNEESFIPSWKRGNVDEAKLKGTVKLKDDSSYASYPQYAKMDIEDKFGEIVDDYDYDNGKLTIKFNDGVDKKIVRKALDFIKESAETVLDEKRVTKPIKLKDFLKILDKHGYAEETEEVAFALKDEEFSTCGDMKCIVKKLNSINMSLEDTEEMLKDALN